METAIGTNVELALRTQEKHYHLQLRFFVGVALSSVYPSSGGSVRVLQETDDRCKCNLGEFNEEEFAKV